MIIVNNAFVYIHHPKTGGTFVTEMLKRVASTSKEFTIQELPGLKHAGVRKIPDEHRHLPILINVRNVFEHYVSRYTFRWWADPGHYQKRFNMEKVRKDFQDFPEIGFAEFLRLINDWSYPRNFPRKKKDKLSRLEIGYNTWTLARLLIKNPVRLLERLDELDDQQLLDEFLKVRFLRTENLNSDLYNLLKGLGLKQEILSPILDSGPILPKKGGRGKGKETWHNYFTQDDIDFVRHKDRLYFRLFPDMLQRQ